MSLLTQFYPGPGGGGGNTIVGPGGGGAIQAILAPATLSLNVAISGSLAQPSPGVLTGTAITGYGVSSGVYERAYVPGRMDNITLQNRVKTITLNGGYIGQIDGTSTSLEAVDGFGSLAGLNITSAPNFTTVADTVNVWTNSYYSANFNCLDCNLDAASVNHILVSLAYNGSGSLPLAATTLTIDLSTGGSAGSGALTAAGLAAVSALTANGGTVTLNP